MINLADCLVELLQERQASSSKKTLCI